MHDMMCKYEANQQYKRDKAVDKNILFVLRSRLIDCSQYYQDSDMNEPTSKCYEVYVSRVKWKSK